MKLNKKLNSLTGITTLMIILLSSVYAAVMYTQTISWTFIEQTKTISVDQPTTLPLGEIVGPTTITKDYIVTNTGNVAITVTPNAQATGATTAWTPLSQTIQPQASATFTLTISITGAGTVTVTFDIT